MSNMKTVIDDIQRDYGFSDGEIESIISICGLMPTDPDGCWSMLEDGDLFMELDDVAIICELFA